MRIKRLLEIDYTIFFSVVLLTFFGILFIYSSGITSAGVVVSNEYVKQTIWAIISIMVCLLIAMLDYRRIYDLTGYIYIAMLAVLIYTRLFGRVVNGARSWLGIGAFGIQPSEFAKIATILFLACYLDKSRHEQNSLKRFAFSCCIVFIPMILILAQPDLGTALVFLPILLVITFIAGLPLMYIAYLGLFIAITSFLTILPLSQEYIFKGSIPILNVFTNRTAMYILFGLLISVGVCSLFGYRKFSKKYFFWITYAVSLLLFALLSSLAARAVLKDYQIMRLIVFIDPNIDPKGSGWNIIQSVTAIGSGGLWGKGFLEGTQSHYRFLPQQSTDFIFSIYSEEWGLLGGLLVFALNLLISLRCIRIIKTTSDPFAAYIVAGLSSVYIFHFIVNVGMTMGIMPITGIPLLFMSYGGSSLLAAMSGIGVILSIYLRRYEH